VFHLLLSTSFRAGKYDQAFRIEDAPGFFGCGFELFANGINPRLFFECRLPIFAVTAIFAYPVAYLYCFVTIKSIAIDLHFNLPPFPYANLGVMDVEGDRETREKDERRECAWTRIAATFARFSAFHAPPHKRRCEMLDARKKVWHSRKINCSLIVARTVSLRRFRQLLLMENFANYLASSFWHLIFS
ncbi:MAG: hypothetical protein L0220_32280, partial [Acidobacteria bacterium]|nr:hypothetical protein [Acidobacteriota bacterium]